MNGRTFVAVASVLGACSLFALVPDVVGYAAHDHGDGSYAGQQLAPISLVDQRGRLRSIVSLRGRPLVLAFFCTRCEQARICDGVGGELAYLQARLPPSYRLLEMTFDPARDTRSERMRYATRYGADADRWLLASGTDDDETQTYASAFGVRDEPPSAGAAHTETLTIVDASGRIVERASTGPSWDAQSFLRDAAIVDGAHASLEATLAFALRRAENLPPGARELLFAAPALLYFAWLSFVFTRYARRSETFAHALHRHIDAE